MQMHPSPNAGIRDFPTRGGIGHHSDGVAKEPLQGALGAFASRAADQQRHAAIDQFQEVSRLAPQEAAQAYEMLGEIFARKKGRSVQNTKVWFQHAADMYVKKDLSADATRAYLRILDLEPDNRDILHALGDLYAKQERLQEAVETYRKLAGLYADNKPLDKD